MKPPRWGSGGTPGPRRVDELVRSYLGRMPDARQAHETDAQYRLTTDWLRRVLGTLDMALDDEGVDAAVRDRVLRIVLFGSADDAGAALRRQESLVREAELLRTVTGLTDGASTPLG